MLADQATDAELMGEVANDDRQALERLIRRHADSLLAFLVRILRDRQRSEDAFQEVFLSVWRGRQQYYLGQPFRPWLYKIALNQCRSMLRSRAARSSWQALEGLPAADGQSSPEESAVATETACVVQAAVARLPEAQRHVVLLRVWSGLSYGEIADVVGSAETTVRSNMHHALRALRRQLTDRWT